MGKRGPKVRQSLWEKFWDKVLVDDDDKCWNWIASCTSIGYGKITHNGIMISAHRVSWILTRGEIPKDMCILHHCDNRKCVNPSHLWVGTKADNNRDRSEKGRSANRKGENSVRSILTEKDVLEIRNSYYPRTEKRKEELADKYGVSKYTIQNVIYRTTWKHID